RGAAVRLVFDLQLQKVPARREREGLRRGVEALFRLRGGEFVYDDRPFPDVRLNAVAAAVVVAELEEISRDLILGPESFRRAHETKIGERDLGVDVDPRGFGCIVRFDSDDVHVEIGKGRLAPGDGSQHDCEEQPENGLTVTHCQASLETSETVCRQGKDRFLARPSGCSGPVSSDFAGEPPEGAVEPSTEQRLYEASPIKNLQIFDSLPDPDIFYRYLEFVRN